MKLQIAEYDNTTYYIDAMPLCSIYLWKDGTLNKGSTGWTKAGSPREMSDAPGYWRTQQEAQQFLDKWMPRKKKLPIYDVQYYSTLGEMEALDCSIEHWKQNVLDVDDANLGSSYCAICVRAKKESGAMGKNQCVSCILNSYKRGVTNCCEEYKAFVNNGTEENAIAMLNKLVLIRNNKYGNPYEIKKEDYFHGRKEKKKMAKIEFDDGVKVELSKETTERLRKELVKSNPYQFKAGDVVKNHYGYRRIIIEHDDELLSFGINPVGIRSEGQKDFEKAGYAKIGELEDFIDCQ